MNRFYFVGTPIFGALALSAFHFYILYCLSGTHWYELVNISFCYIGDENHGVFLDLRRKLSLSH